MGRFFERASKKWFFRTRVQFFKRAFEKTTFSNARLKKKKKKRPFFFYARPAFRTRVFFFFFARFPILDLRVFDFRTRVRNLWGGYFFFFPQTHRFRTRVRKSKTRKSKIGKRAHEKKKKNARSKSRTRVKKKGRFFFFFQTRVRKSGFFERAFEKLDARSKKPLFRRAFEKPPHVNMRLPLFRTRVFFFFRFSNARFFSRFFRTRVFFFVFQTRVLFSFFSNARFLFVFSERAFFFFSFFKRALENALKTRTRVRNLCRPGKYFFFLFYPQGVRYRHRFFLIVAKCQNPRNFRFFTSA